MKLKRDKNGILHIYAKDLVEAYRGLGRAHAEDRGLQMLMMRIVGQGRASEILDSSEELLQVDKIFRKMHFYNFDLNELKKMSAHAEACLTAYVEGVEQYFQKKTPWELKLVGYKHEPWTIKDSIILIRMMGYVGMGEAQGSVERLFLELVQNGVEHELLSELFPGVVTDYDKELIKKTNLGQKLIPDEVLNSPYLPQFMASNNWVVSGRLTQSGLPVLANDPHLEIGRLPNIWYEVALHWGENYFLGFTIPGMPGAVIGRTQNVSWGVTYSYADGIDHWIEECRGHEYRNFDGFKPFRVRQETVKRKKKPSVRLEFFENERGTLCTSLEKDGFYLNSRWSGEDSGVQSLEAMVQLLSATSAQEVMNDLGRVELSFNWVVADSENNIGYQMSGKLPLRPEGQLGFVPQNGWDKNANWLGYCRPEDLPRTLNPECGYIVTANNNLNHFASRKAITACMGEYRARRIESLLQGKNKLRAEDNAQIQMDLYSLQAKDFMQVLGPLISHDVEAEILKAWDFCYAENSTAAFLFDEFYKELLQSVFGESHGFRAMGLKHLLTRTFIVNTYFESFDRILLNPKSRWFKNKTQGEYFSQAWTRVKTIPRKTWGEAQKSYMNHMFFGGKLPRFLGFDYGPFALPGGRATICQGQRFYSGEHLCTFSPTVRFATDLAENHLLTQMVGGPSDRRFSKWYLSGTKSWLKGQYKRLF